MSRKIDRVEIEWVRRNEKAWLSRTYPNGVVRLPRNPLSPKIEFLSSETDRLGPQPLWRGYPPQTLGDSRSPNDVRASQSMGKFYSHLVTCKKPDVVVEFGTAFGVSGMYFLSGLQTNGRGMLLTFEPNEIWAAIALANLKQISPRFDLTIGTFEENIGLKLKEKTIDIALIDAVHTSEFVLLQLELVVRRSKQGTIILLDDICFSEDMRGCWEKVSHDPRFITSAVINNRVGLLELA